MKKFMLLILVIGVLLSPIPALAVDFSIENYDMTVDVLRDGSAAITETLEYDFDSEYNGILSTFDIGDVTSLEDMRLFVDGETELARVDEMNNIPFTYTATVDGDLLEVRAYAPGGEGARVFRYEYTLVGLTQRYQDAARLNYKLIGTKNEVRLKNAVIEIRLPGEILNAWAHGAMRTDDIQRDGNLLIYGPKTVPVGQFVEADILFDQAPLSEASVIDEPIIEDARALEAWLLQQEHEERVRREQLLTFAKCALLAAFALFLCGSLLIMLKSSRAIGLKHSADSTSDNTALRGVRAAVAQFVYRQQVDTYGLTGTLLELAQLGALTMRKPLDEAMGVSFARKNPVSGLSEHQNFVLTWLFSDDEPLYSDSLNAEENVDMARKFEKNLDRFNKLVREEAEAKGYTAPRTKLYTWGIPLMIIAGLAIMVGFFLLSLWPFGAASAVMTLILIIFPSRLRSLSDEGERVLAALQGVAERAEAQPLTKDEMWLTPIIAALDFLEPFFDQVQEDYWEYAPYFYMGWHHDVHHTQRDMHTARTHNRDLIAKHNSSSSGGGSSSSGGGGGGGGHGAW